MNNPVDNHLDLAARQTQQQQLTAKQLQTLELLALPVQNLEARLKENPLIETQEEIDSDFIEPVSPDDKGQTTEDESLFAEQAFENNDDLESSRTPDDNEGLEEFILDDPRTPDDENENDFSDQSFSSDDNDFSADSTSGNDFLDYTAAPEEDFREELLMELNTRKGLSETFRKLCESIIISLDDNGLLSAPPADIAQNSQRSIEEVCSALEYVQEFDPPGIAARNIPECLIIQLRRKDKLTPFYETLFNEHWNELRDNRLESIAKSLGISMKQLQEMLLELSRLPFYPIQAGKGGAQPIFPEIEIRPYGSGFIAVPLRGKYSFTLNADADKPHTDAGADFMATLKEAKVLLEAMAYRKDMLFNIAEMIIDTQRDFLEEGPEKLAPFTMKQAAEYLDVSESTISRAAAEKYIKTPQGVLPLKSFFTTGYINDEGVAVSRTADMELLKQLVDKEDKRHPLSDEKLSQLLNEAGHPVARRTVAKYRSEMNIPSSTLRKEYF